MRQTPPGALSSSQLAQVKTRRSHPRAAAIAIMAQQANEEEAPLTVVIAKASSSKNLATETRAKKRATEGDEPTAKKPRLSKPVYEAAPIITDLPPLPFTTTSPKKKGKSKKIEAKTNVNHSVRQVEGDDKRYCEFCRKVENICVAMHCRACRRVYHAGCFVHAFKPHVDENVPILDQMENLQLNAPDRRGNIFRCASCKAAFLDFYESGGYLWDCNCPTCSQPEKLVFYRQRKLIEMMNDMELEKQRKREQKGKKKSDTASSNPVSTPSRSNSVSRGRRQRESTVTRRSTSRSRGDSPEIRELKKGDDASKVDAMDVVGKSVTESKDTMMETKKNDEVEPMDVDAGGGLQTTLSGETKPEADHNNEPQQQIIGEKPKYLQALDQQAKAKPAAQTSNELATALKQEDQTRTIKQEPSGEPEQPKLSGNELVCAVRVQREDKNKDYGWCFPVMCSKTSSLRVSGVMKTGTCKWFPKKMALIECNCCGKLFNYSEFAHHTDSGLIKDAKCAKEDPMMFLFVEHRDTSQHTPLDDFLPALRSWSNLQSLNDTRTKSRRGRPVKQDALTTAITPAATMTDPEVAKEAVQTALARLQALALFKRPKPRNDKTSTVARLSDPANLDFVAQVVCISPKYVMNMQNGSLVDRVVRSQTPVPEDSFPRKAGWLAFNRQRVTARHITCVCCEKSFNFDAFASHAGISLNDLKKKSRQLLYVVERQDEAALVPLTTFLPDLKSHVDNNELNAFLGELLPPPPSPRSL